MRKKKRQAGHNTISNGRPLTTDKTTIETVNGIDFPFKNIMTKKEGVLCTIPKDINLDLCDNLLGGTLWYKNLANIVKSHYRYAGLAKKYEI